jgi:Protein of unknown function (DUF1097)
MQAHGVEKTMDLITALAVSIGVLGGIATFVMLSPFGLGLQIWATFIAWATFYHCGGKEAGLSKTITHTIFGAIMAYIALLLVTQVPLGAALGVPLWAAICVLVTVFILVYAAKSATLSDIPRVRPRIRRSGGDGLGGQQTRRINDGLTREPVHQHCDIANRWLGARLYLAESRRSNGQEIGL